VTAIGPSSLSYASTTPEYVDSVPIAVNWPTVLPSTASVVIFNATSLPMGLVLDRYTG
jgi:hypothetical protein